ncbi:MAG: cell division protein FtsH, partial [Pseudomonadota bacterium]
MARAMVTEWGLSDIVGPIYHGGDQRDQYLGGGTSMSGNISQKTAELIDAEVKILVDEGYKHAHTLLKKHIKKLHKLAESLLQYETLTGEDIKLIMNNKSLKKVSKPSDTNKGDKAENNDDQGAMPKIAIKNDKGDK